MSSFRTNFHYITILLKKNSEYQCLQNTDILPPPTKFYFKLLMLTSRPARHIFQYNT